MAIIILTSYHGPTNHRQSYVSAKIPARGIKVTVPFNDDNDKHMDDSYKRAAQKALDKFNEQGPKYEGRSKWTLMEDPNPCEPGGPMEIEYDHNGYAFVAGVWR